MTADYVPVFPGAYLQKNFLMLKKDALFSFNHFKDNFRKQMRSPIKSQHQLGLFFNSFLHSNFLKPNRSIDIKI